MADGSVAADAGGWSWVLLATDVEPSGDAGVASDRGAVLGASGVVVWVGRNGTGPRGSIVGGATAALVGAVCSGTDVSAASDGAVFGTGGVEGAAAATGSAGGFSVTPA